MSKLSNLIIKIEKNLYFRLLVIITILIAIPIAIKDCVGPVHPKENVTLHDVFQECKQCNLEKTFKERYDEYGLTLTILEQDLIAGDYIPSKEAYNRTTEDERMNAGDYFEEAKSLMNAGDYEKALELINKSLELNPHSNIWNLKGLIHYNLGEIDQAIRNFEKTLENVPNDRDALSKLGAIYHNNKKEYSIARCIFEGTLKLYPNDVEILANYAVVLASMKDHTKAIEYFSRVIETTKDTNNGAYIKALHDRGLSYYKTGDYAKAIKDFNETLGTQFDKNSLFHIGASQLYLGDYAAGLDAFDKVQEKYEDELSTDMKYDIYYNRGVTYHLHIINQTKAFENLKKASEIKEKYEVFHWLGLSAFKLGKHEEVIYFLNKSIELNPEDFVAWHFKAKSLHLMGRFEEALEAYDKALEINPKEPSILGDKGRCLAHLGRYEEALELFDMALEINPTYDLDLKDKGATLYNLGRYEEALEVYNQALETYPHDAELWFGKGSCFYMLNKLEEALEAYNKALEINPNYKEVLEYKNIILEKIS